MSHTIQSTGRFGRKARPSARRCVTSGSSRTSPFSGPLSTAVTRNAAARELPCPAAGRGAEIDRAHPGAQQLGFALAQERDERLGELQRRARRRAAGHPQPRNPHRPPAGPRRDARADIGVRAVDEEHVEIARGRWRVPCVGCVAAGRARASAASSRGRERAGERRQLLAVVGVRRSPAGAMRSRVRCAGREIRAGGRSCARAVEKRDQRSDAVGAAAASRRRRAAVRSGAEEQPSGRRSAASARTPRDHAGDSNRSKRPTTKPRPAGASTLIPALRAVGKPRAGPRLPRARSRRGNARHDAAPSNLFGLGIDRLRSSAGTGRPWPKPRRAAASRMRRCRAWRRPARRTVARPAAGPG